MSFAGGQDEPGAIAQEQPSGLPGLDDLELSVLV